MKEWLLKLLMSSFVDSLARWINRRLTCFIGRTVHVGRFAMVASSFDRYLALWLWRMGLLEAAEQALIPRLCPQGGRVVDIGANMGIHTLAMADAVGCQGTVMAFEPDPRNAAALRSNIERNAIANVTVFEKAVGDKTGTVCLWRSHANSGDHRIYAQSGALEGERVDVGVVKLDDFPELSGVVDFIKMDIQGAEGMALRGMRHLLERSSSVILLFEFWPSALKEAGTDARQMLKGLIDMGFHLWCVTRRGKLKQTTEDELLKITGQGYRNVVACRDTSDPRIKALQD